MSTTRIALCIAAMTPGLLLAEKAAEAPAPAPKSAAVAPAAAPAAAAAPATAPAEATPAVPVRPPHEPKPTRRPSFSGILDVTKDAENKITGITLKVDTNRTHTVKIDEQSLKLAESAAGKRVRIIGKLIDEVANNVTNNVLKVDAYYVPSRPTRPPTPDAGHAPAAPAAVVTPPTPATPAPAAVPAPAPEATKK